MDLAPDCRHYLGDRPCAFGCKCRCEHYAPMGRRILIIKLGALGDVVRTASLLPALKKQYDPCHITWISRPNGTRILAGHPLIDRQLNFDAEGILRAAEQEFDTVISLDKEPGPTALCNRVRCADKRGICLSAWGTPQPLNAGSEYFFALGLDDQVKFFENDKTYPQLIHEAAELPYCREPYRLVCDEASVVRAQAMFAPWRAERNGPVVGLNTGWGHVFANKAPRPSRWVEVARMLLARGYTVALLGGANERQQNQWIRDRVGEGVYLTGSDNTEPQFVAIVDQCDLIVAGDTLAMHVAIARRVPVVALFGPTCPAEIDLFDLGRKIVSPHECVPCYHRVCNRIPNCMDLIPPEDIASAVENLLGQSAEQGSAA